MCRMSDATRVFTKTTPMGSKKPFFLKFNFVSASHTGKSASELLSRVCLVSRLKSRQWDLVTETSFYHGL